MFNHVSDLMRTNARARALVAVAGATGMTLYASVFTVPAGHIGVESLFGDVYERSYSPGIHVSHPLTRVKCYDIRVQNTALKCESVTADGLAIQSNLAVRWRLDPAHATQTRRTVAGNVETTILTPMLVDAVTRATSRHGVSALFDATTRANIGTQMREMLGDKCSACSRR